MSESRVKLSYQACPDIEQSESREEVLTCLGHWADDRDATQSFLVATLDFRYRRTLEDRLRCFLIKQARLVSNYNCLNTDHQIVVSAFPNMLSKFSHKANILTDVCSDSERLSSVTIIRCHLLRRTHKSN